VNRFRSVNRPFPAFSPIPGNPVFGAKIAAGRRGASLTFRSDSIEAREASDTRRKKQEAFRLFLFTSGAAAPSEERLSSGRPS
jgi:hypothetical protein